MSVIWVTITQDRGAWHRVTEGDPTAGEVKKKGKYKKECVRKYYCVIIEINIHAKKAEDAVKIFSFFSDRLNAIVPTLPN